MRVRELIEKLQEMDQDAVVNVFQYSDVEFGDIWDTVKDVIQKPTGWDWDTMAPVPEVFIE